MVNITRLDDIFIEDGNELILLLIKSDGYLNNSYVFEYKIKSEGIEEKVYNYIMKNINNEKRLDDWIYLNKEIYTSNSSACFFLRGVDRSRKLSEFLNL